MALTTIKATNADADITIDGVSYANTADSISVRSDAPEENETVFSSEGTGGESSIGTEMLTIDISGILKKGASNAIPFLPLSAYTDSSFDIQFDTGCNITGTLNIFTANPNAVAGRTRRWSATARSTGIFVVTWATA